MHRKLLVDLCKVPHAEEITPEDVQEALAEWLNSKADELTVTAVFSLGSHEL